MLWLFRPLRGGKFEDLNFWMWTAMTCLIDSDEYGWIWSHHRCTHSYINHQIWPCLCDVVCYLWPLPLNSAPFASHAHWEKETNTQTPVSMESLAISTNLSCGFRRGSGRWKLFQLNRFSLLPSIQIFSSLYCSLFLHSVCFNLIQWAYLCLVRWWMAFSLLKTVWPVTLGRHTSLNTMLCLAVCVCEGKDR